LAICRGSDLNTATEREPSVICMDRAQFASPDPEGSNIE